MTTGTGTYLLGGPAKLDCEVAVIGAGVGGSVVSSKLAARGIDTILLDEGPFQPNAEQTLRSSDIINRLWRGGGLTAALSQPPLNYAEGRCVGGGSEINSGIFQRCPSDLLDEWASTYRIDDFGGNALEALYDESARIVNAHIPGDERADALVLSRAAKNLGWAHKRLERAQAGENDGRPEGLPVKQSMTKTLLPPALGQGLRLIAQCRARKLAMKSGRVEQILAVATDAQGRAHKVTIRAKHIILCGGAIETPALLRKSGVTHNVGNSLRLHPTLRATCLFNEPVGADPSPVPLSAITEFMPEFRIGGSVFTPGFFAMALAEDWERRGWMLPEVARAGMYYVMIRAQGKGRIRVVPGLPDPLVFYQLTREDWKTMHEGLHRLVQAMFAAGATHVYPSITGHKGWQDGDNTDKILSQPLPRNQCNLMTIHLMGSCPPGNNKELCATDSFGKVYDTENIYVADASQIPEAAGVNPQATIMAIALRNVRRFIETQF